MTLSSPTIPTKVFISYSHADAEWLERLKRHLKPLVRDGRIESWDDTHIRPGDDWQREIRDALTRARVAVLLISADFFASDFIDESELPPLLDAARAQGVRILPVILSASRFARDPGLARFQAVNPPSQPLKAMSPAEQEEILDRLARTIEDEIDDASHNSEQENTAGQTSSAPIADNVNHKLIGNERHLVILVHGIRTRAQWQSSVGQALRDAGFEFAATGYGVFGIFRFLFPLPWFRRAAVARVTRHIRNAKVNHENPPRTSIIAHSFGTYVVAEILIKETDLKWNRVIFCGSVVPADYDFAPATLRIILPILNEIGTRDVWPAVAEAVSWNYGAIGSYGLQAPEVENRWHLNVGHSDYLTPAFCNTNWVPFLHNTEPHPRIASGASPRTDIPIWLRGLLWLPLRWAQVAVLLMVVGASVLWFMRPEALASKSLPGATGTAIHYYGRAIATAKAAADAACNDGWLWNLLQSQRCITVDWHDSSIENMVTCKPFSVTGRDAIELIENLIALHPGCVAPTRSSGSMSIGWGNAELPFYVDRNGVKRAICDCDASQVSVLQQPSAP